MNFYKRHIGDYLKDTAHLSLLEHGVYTRLLDVYYTRESGIPEAQVSRLIGARSKEECAALQVVLDEFFELIDGTWIQDRCEREIHATAPSTDEANGAPVKSGKARRQQEYRERRAALFEALRERGITMPFKATMNELQDALLAVTKPTHVTVPVMERVTDDYHNVTATNSHHPDSSSQTPDLKPNSNVVAIASRETPDDFVPKDEGEWLRHLKAKHGFEANPGDINDRKRYWKILARWVNAKITARQLDTAIARAYEDSTEPISNIVAYADRVLETLNAPKKKRVDTWWLTNETMCAKARELGIPDARAGESPAAFKARIQQAIDARGAA
jgi:uncharacterized protein YdaU (DUF1376 family)